MSRMTPTRVAMLCAVLTAGGVAIPAASPAEAVAAAFDINSICTGTSTPQATCLYEGLSKVGVFTFPSGVDVVQIELRGGDGGDGGSSEGFGGGTGGVGGRLGAADQGAPVTLTRGQSGGRLFVYVGSPGGNPSCNAADPQRDGGTSGGVRTGGDGGHSADDEYCWGGGGGGGTFVTKADAVDGQGNFVKQKVLAVAGGGGGGGGADSSPPSDAPTPGYTGFAGGDGGGSESGTDGGGPRGGRSGNAGGAGGTAAEDGDFPEGGDGAEGGDVGPSGCSSPCGAGGGGGGGYLGGGGGGMNSGGGGGCQFVVGQPLECATPESLARGKGKRGQYAATAPTPGFARIGFAPPPSDQPTGPAFNDPTQPNNRGGQGRFDKGHTDRKRNEVVCKPEVGVCVLRVTGPDSKFVVTARGGKRRAVLFGNLQGGAMPDCRNYAERQSDWLQFGFRDGRAGSTWRKTSSITTRKTFGKAKALKRATAMQVCFEAPYYFAPRPGFGVVKTGKVWTGVLPDCPSASGGPCVTGREIRSLGDAGWAVRLVFRIPATPLDPKALG